MTQIVNLQDAFNLLGLSLGATKPEIKKAFRKASSIHHPDKGGSTAVMQSYTAAYEMASNALNNDVTSSTYREDLSSTWCELGRTIRTDMEKQFSVDLFAQYFSDVFGEQITLIDSISAPSDEWLSELELKKGNRSPHYASVKAEWANADRSKVLQLSISVYLADAYNASSQLAGEGVTYRMGVSTFFYNNGRKVKITKRDYDHTQKADVLTKPAATFPKAKLTKKRKTTFKRADMIAGLTAELEAESSTNGNYYIPLAGGSILTVYRTTFMRKGVWHVDGVWMRSKLIKRRDNNFKTLFVSFMEEEETLEIFRSVAGMEPQAALDQIQSVYDAKVVETKK